MLLCLRARLGSAQQLECLMLWPLYGILIIGCLLTALLDLQIWWLVPIPLLSGWLCWRGMTLRARVRSWQPPAWRAFAQNVTGWRDLMALDVAQFTAFCAWLYQSWGYTTLPTGEGDQFLISRPGSQRTLVTCVLRPLGKDDISLLEHDITAMTGTGIIITPSAVNLLARLYVTRRSHLQLVDGALLCDWIASWQASRHVSFDERAAQRLVLARVS